MNDFKQRGYDKNRSNPIGGKRIRINNEIQAATVRVIGPIGIQDRESVVLPLEEALRLTEAAEVELRTKLDLVEIAPKAVPPVCQIVDYNKYIFELKKKKDAQRKKQKKTELKEIKFRQNIGAHDYKVKLNHLIDFLNENNKVKITLQLYRREMDNRARGQALMEQLTQDLASYGVVEMPAKFEGRQMIMIMAPTKKQ